LKARWISLIMAATLVAPFAIADGGGSNSGWRANAGTSRTSGVRSQAPDTRLIGITIFDTGLDVIRRFGDPDEIQAIGGGGSAIGPAGGGGGPSAAGAAGGNRGGGGGGGNSASALGFSPDPAFGGLPTNLFQEDPLLGEGGRGGPQGGPPPPPRGGGPSAAGQPGGPSAAGAAGGPGGGVGNAGAGSRVLFTRWIYRENQSRYGFVFDKFNRVVQIEAIGTSDSRVNTNRGIRFGSTFADIIRRYGAPDGYEINGDSLVVRYLVKQKVAFRLNRLQKGKPHQVTGVVVAAGKQ
jgi:hypothetical protein